MQVLINIPNEKAERLLAQMRLDRNFRECEVTLLPKGYGRLIDARAFSETMYHQAFETDSDMQKWDSGCWIRYKMFENALCDAPTIIEADRG